MGVTADWLERRENDTIEARKQQAEVARVEAKRVEVLAAAHQADERGDRERKREFQQAEELRLGNATRVLRESADAAQRQLDAYRNTTKRDFARQHFQ